LNPLTSDLDVVMKADEQVRLARKDALLDLEVGPAGQSSRLAFSPAPGVTIETEVRYGAKKPTNVVTAGFTAPIRRIVSTTIHGLTSSPLVLGDAAAHTICPLHHNEGARLLVEPARDPSLTDAQRAELRALDIQTIFVVTGQRAFDGTPRGDNARYQGLDGAWRRPDAPTQD
jgi:hypothetical protein